MDFRFLSSCWLVCCSSCWRYKAYSLIPLLLLRGDLCLVTSEHGSWRTQIDQGAGSSGHLLTRGGGFMEKPEKAEQYHAKRTRVLNLEYASKSPGRFLKIQIWGPTPSISDSVSLSGPGKLAFLSISVVMLMLLVWGPHFEILWHTAQCVDAYSW